VCRSRHGEGLAVGLRAEKQRATICIALNCAAHKELLLQSLEALLVVDVRCARKASGLAGAVE
jgi:hypothetical protein